MNPGHPGAGQAPAPSAVHSLALAEAAQLKFLDPGKLRFFTAGATLRLTIENECSHLKVAVLRAFPLSRPGCYLSIRDAGGKEIGLLADLEALDPESRRRVEADLERRYLVACIHRVRAVKERFGVVEWDVETQRGPCKFTTRDLRDNVLHPLPGRYLFTDVDGNRYTVANLEGLDSQSQAWLLQHL